jgi:chromosome segregation ATPase
VPTKNALEDLTTNVRRLVGIVNSLLERFARGYEELDSNRLALEEIREHLGEYFEESSIWANGLSKRIDRLEQYIILSRMGDAQQSGEITQQVKGEHIRRSLREELTTQQELLTQYHKNIDRVKIKIAKYGETTPLMNEIDDYQREIDKINEAIGRIRDALK